MPFCQTNQHFHCFEFHDLASWKTLDLKTKLRIFENSLDNEVYRKSWNFLYYENASGLQE